MPTVALVLMNVVMRALLVVNARRRAHARRRALCSRGAASLLLALAMLLFAHGAKAQTLRCPEGVLDCFVDNAGSIGSAHRAYRLLHKPPVPHHMRAFAMEVTWLAIGTTWYW